MLSWIVENTAVACLLALVALCATYFYRSRPALCHMLWVIVLVRLVMPPVAIPGWPPRELKSAVRNAIEVAIPSVESAPVSLPSSVKSQPASAALAWGEAEASGFEAIKRDPWDWKSAQLGVPEYGDSLASTERDSAKRVTSVEDSTSAAADSQLAPARIWFWILVVAWTAGSLGILSLWVLRTMHFRKAIANTASAPEDLRLAVDGVAKDLGLRAPRIRMNGSLGGPSLWCFGRPVLLWPDSMAHGSAETIRPVIAHELSHLRRRDHWTAWLEMVATLIMWWHPLVWIARKQLRLYAELACDARVVASMPTERRHYAESLIAAASAGSLQQPPAALAAVDSNRRTFEQRVRLIMQGRMSDHVSLASAIMLVAVTLIVAPTWAGSVGSWWFPSTQVDSSVREAVADEFLSVRADRYYRAETWDEAAAAYEDVVANDPSNGAAVFRLGVSLINSARAECALDVIRRQLDLGYREGEAHFLRARAYAMLDNAHDATAALREALLHGFVDQDRINNDSALAQLIKTDTEANEVADNLSKSSMLMAAAENHLAKKEWWSARAKLRAAAIVSPMSSRVQRHLALATEHVDLMHEAESAWQRQDALGSNKAEAMFNIARFRSRNGLIDGAVDALGQAVSLGFDDASRIEEDAWLDAVRQDATYKKLIYGIKEPQRLRALVGRALLAESYDHAVAAADKLLALENLTLRQRGVAHHAKGMALLGLGETEDASTEFMKQIKYGFWLTEGLYRIACCRSAEGKGAEAFAYLDMAVEARMHGGDAGPGMNGGLAFRDQAMLSQISGTKRFDHIFDLAKDNYYLELFGAADWEHLKQISSDAVTENPSNGKAYTGLGWALLRLGEYKEAVKIFRTQDGLWPNGDPIARYNVACAYALQNKKPEAMKWLHAAAVVGWRDFKYALQDPDLANLRDDPDFQRMCGKAAE